MGKIIDTEGTFEVYVTGSALKEGTEGKTDQVIVSFEEPTTGDYINAYLFLSEKAWPYSAEKLATCGWDAQARGYRFDELNADPSPIKGAAVQIVTKHERYEGKLQTKVTFINPAGSTRGAGVERMESQQAASFATRLRSKLAGISYNKPTTAPSFAAPASDAREPWDQ